MSGGAACCQGDRIGLVSNQDPRGDWDRNEPLVSSAVCAKHIDKQIAYVAGKTNRRATFYADGAA